MGKHKKSLNKIGNNGAPSTSNDALTPRPYSSNAAVSLNPSSNTATVPPINDSTSLHDQAVMSSPEDVCMIKLGGESLVQLSEECSSFLSEESPSCEEEEVTLAQSPLLGDQVVREGLTRSVDLLEPSTSSQSFEDVTEPSNRAGNVLNKNPASMIKSSDLARIRVAYSIPNEGDIRAAELYERVDWDSPGWLSMYEYIFKIGFRLPVPPLVRMLLKHYEIAPSQLMPNAWRILLGCEILAERQRTYFGLNELLDYYFLKEHDESGRYYLVLRPKRDPLVTIPSNDRYWKAKYFFVSGKAMFGEDADIPHAWCRTGRTGVGYSTVGLNTADRIAAVLRVPEDQRSHLVVLSKASLRASRLWRQVPATLEDQIMSSRVQMLDSERAAQRRLQKIKSRGGQREVAEPTGNQAALALPVTQAESFHDVEQSQRLKRHCPEESASDTDQITITLPSNASSQSEPSIVLPSIEKLLLPEDATLLKNMGPSRSADWGMIHVFQALQAQVHQKKEIASLTQRLHRSQASNVALKKSEVEAVERSNNAEERLAAIELEMAKKDWKLRMIERENEGLRRELEGLKNEKEELISQLEDISDDATLEVEARLMRQYKEGKDSEWKVDEVIARYEEVQRAVSDAHMGGAGREDEAWAGPGC